MTEISLNSIRYVAIENNKEALEEKLDFEFLVIALGSLFEHPFQPTVYDRAEQVALNQETLNKTKEAKRVLVIGGGAVGVEVAGELATDCPDKHVTLVTSAERLLHRMTESFSVAAMDVLKSKKVHVILKDSVDLQDVENFKPNKLKTRNGFEIEFDAFFVCVGGRPSTDLVTWSFPEWIDDAGYIKVNKHFNVVTG